MPTRTGDARTSDVRTIHVIAQRPWWSAGSDIPYVFETTRPPDRLTVRAHELEWNVATPVDLDPTGAADTIEVGVERLPGCDSIVRVPFASLHDGDVYVYRPRFLPLRPGRLSRRAP